MATSASRNILMAVKSVAQETCRLRDSRRAGELYMSEPDPDTPLSAHLHHLGIQSSDPARLSAFYSRALGLQFERRRNAFIGVAHERCLIIEPGRDRTLAFAAYEVAQPQQLSAMRARLQRAGLSTAGSPTEIFEDDAVCVRDPDGNTL